MNQATIKSTNLAHLDATLEAFASSGSAPLPFNAKRRPQARRISIRFISVVHFTKQNGKYYFACRVLGESDALAYTVSKTWDQFLDFSQRLADAFPQLAQKQLPRLNKKMALFVTRSTMAQRRDDLDLWVRRLFDISEVRNSWIFRDFFSHDDLTSSDAFKSYSNASAESPTIRPPHTSRPSLSLPRKDSVADMHRPRKESLSQIDQNRLPQQLSPTTCFGQPQHPTLAHKRSTPNLRYGTTDFLDYDLPPTPTAKVSPLILQRSSSDVSTPVESDPVSPRASDFQTAPAYTRLMRNRPSLDSVARSISTECTVTPASLAMSTSTVSPPASVLAQDEDDMLANEKNLPSPPRPKGPLRHFMSLQDIRATVTPHPAIPSITSERSRPEPVYVPATGMTRSRSSSNASDYGTPLPLVNSTPLHLVQGAALSRAQIDYHRPRRPSARSNRSFGAPYRMHKASGSGSSAHSHSKSASSISSLDFDINSSSASSRDFSIDSYSSSKDSLSLLSSPASSALPATPPTPQWSENGMSSMSKGLPDHVDAFGYSVFSPGLVPLPDTMQFAGSPRCAPTNSRSRSGSLAINPRPLDPILGSPSLSSIPSVPSTPASVASSPNSAFPLPPISDLVTLKVRHGDSNVVLRVAKASRLDEVKTKIGDKLRANGIKWSPSADLWLTMKPADSMMQTDATFLLEADESWRQATTHTNKLVLTT